MIRGETAPADRGLEQTPWFIEQTRQGEHVVMVSYPGYDVRGTAQTDRARAIRPR
jgi:hypothetical protein